MYSIWPRFYTRLYSVLCILIFVAYSSADTPANCTFSDVKGTWKVTVGNKVPHFEDMEECSNMNSVSVHTFNLLYPNIVTDELGNVGTWTMIYNQGFEIDIANRKYFAFSDFEKMGAVVVSYCNSTKPGWTHDVLQRQWACFRASKQADSSVVYTGPKLHLSTTFDSHTKNMPYRTNVEFIRKINSAQRSWTARVYPEYSAMTIYDLHQRAGGRASYRPSPPVSPPSESLLQMSLRNFPQSHDWRNVSGVNYVSPVRNQGNCGSCYSFASAAMLEARIRIATGNKKQPVLSPQDVVECSAYSQGCQGGFPYLVAGKYAEDFGMADESCNSYTGRDSTTCHTQKNCTRWYATNYRYLGGYYGASNEELMKLELIHNGPIAVGFEVYPDFQAYTGGVYHHTGLTDRFNPFELTNHAVTIVGFGVEAKTGEKFWTVKNSWGAQWGEQGYFRIRRGTDEVGIESLPVAASPVL